MWQAGSDTSFRKNLNQTILTGCPRPFDDKSFAIWFFNIVDGRTVHKKPDGIFDQNIYTVYLDWLFIFFWLIQSHPKIGPASAHSLDEYAQIFTAILVQYLLNFVFCRIGDLYHILPRFH